MTALRETRTTGPVFCSATYGGFWGVTSLDLVRAVLNDPETYSSAKTPEGGGGVFIPPFPTPIGLLPGEADPPYNTTLRSAVMKYFRRQAIEDARPRIQRVANSVIDDIVRRREFDVVADLANVIPAMFIVEYLGFPQQQREGFIAALRGAASAGDESDSEQTQAAMGQAVLALVQHKRTHLVYHAANQLVHNEVTFSDEELVSILSNLFFGGIETSGGVQQHVAPSRTPPGHPHRAHFHTGSHPGRRQRIIRYFTPIMHAARTVTRDVEIAGAPLRKGDRVLLCLQAANHDEQAFPEADAVRIDRGQQIDVAFGFGPHRCLGHLLATTQLEVMVTTFLARAPDYTIDVARARRNDSPGTFNTWTTMPARCRSSVTHVSHRRRLGRLARRRSPGSDVRRP